MSPGFHQRYHGSWSWGHAPTGFYRYRRGPSRIFWFIVGAGAASWFIKSSHCQTNHVKWQPRWKGSDEQQPSTTTPIQAPAGLSGREPSRPSQATPVLQDMNSSSERQRQQELPVQVAKAESSVVDQGVGEAMNLAESTLESILSIAESLKLQLAGQRADRERQQKEAEKRREEELRNPPRWV